MERLDARFNNHQTVMYCDLCEENSYSSRDCQKGNPFAPETEEQVDYVDGNYGNNFQQR